MTEPNSAAADSLLAIDHPLGARRLIVEIDYFETYNRPNVTLVDVAAAPITEITPRGLRTAKGSYDLDLIVYATGFDGFVFSELNSPISAWRISGFCREAQLCQSVRSPNISTSSPLNSRSAIGRLVTAARSPLPVPTPTPRHRPTNPRRVPAISHTTTACSTARRPGLRES